MKDLLEAGVSRVRAAKTILSHKSGLGMKMEMGIGIGLRINENRNRIGNVTGMEFLCFVQVLTAEDCRSDRFLWELQLIEKNEVRLKQSLL